MPPPSRRERWRTVLFTPVHRQVHFPPHSCRPLMILRYLANRNGLVAYLHSSTRIRERHRAGPLKEGANMNSLTMRLTIAAAAFVAVAGVASAQDMEAKIPFAFRANGKVFAAGTYRVNVKTGGIPVLTIRNPVSGESALAVGMPTDPNKSWLSTGDAVLSFHCGVSRCALSKVWMGNTGMPAYSIATPKLGKDE